MGKEKEILKTLLSNQEAIMKHLGMQKQAKPENKKQVKEEPKKIVAKPVVKKDGKKKG